MRGTTVVAYLCKEQIRERRIYGREYTMKTPSLFRQSGCCVLSIVRR